MILGNFILHHNYDNDVNDNENDNDVGSGQIQGWTGEDSDHNQCSVSWY